MVSPDTAFIKNASKQIIEACISKEEELDKQLQVLDNLNDDDYEKIQYNMRRKYINLYKTKKYWESLGHGKLTECENDRHFKELCERSPKVIFHFYKTDMNNKYCEQINKNFIQLAQKHIDIKFVSTNVENNLIICEKLNIQVIPSIVLIKKMNIVKILAGLNEFENYDNMKESDMMKVINKYGFNEHIPINWKDYEDE